jgi:flagella basal body P-ring formation protein FlgA
MLMQLAWLRTKGYPVGLVADDEVELQSAAALGAEVLVASRARVLKDDWRGIAVRLRRIAEAACGNGPRPITQGEVDGLFEGLPSLVAARRLEPGKKVQIEDVAVKAVWRERRGLAPFMLKKVVGRRLRYGLEQDEPFTFGFLKEPDDHA